MPTANKIEAAIVKLKLPEETISEFGFERMDIDTP